ncbi:hypothetical protein [Microbacterium yannicii]|uniref:hypothetical protein n=1 Tax=Microbacterium yannicii TaxID=671622 RepID=UPI00030AFBB0|nr:hypothetical protein [Microbacterium yannicii]
MARQFTAVPIADTGWLIYDNRYPLDDSRHVVAHVEANEDFFDVTWVRPLPLPKVYVRVEDALHDVERCTITGSARSSTRPVPIPHLPPVR